jgi:hypothetical protein
VRKQVRADLARYNLFPDSDHMLPYLLIENKRYDNSPDYANMGKTNQTSGGNERRPCYRLFSLLRNHTLRLWLMENTGCVLIIRAAY